MTLYLLDENVIRELRTGGHANVQAWRKTVNQAQLRVSAIIYFEKRRGWELRHRKNPTLAAKKLAELEAWADAYGPRMIPIDRAIAAEWARLVGVRDRDRLDRALVTTVRVLDPFRKAPKIELV